jgi:hypothetical protein
LSSRSRIQLDQSIERGEQIRRLFLIGRPDHRQVIRGSVDTGHVQSPTPFTAREPIRVRFPLH